MPGAKPNDKGAELLGMEQVPEGFTFRKEAVWAGLEAQLQPERKRPVMVWWWAAAAVVLILAGMALVRQPKASLPVATGLVVQPNVPERNAIPPANERPIVVHPTKPVTGIVTSKAGPVHTQRPPSAVPDTMVLTVPATVQAPNGDSMVAVQAAPVTENKAAQKKPRFPVAHVNELGGPPPQVPAAALPKSHTAFLLKPQQTTIEYGETDESLPARRRKSILPISSSQ